MSLGWRGSKDEIDIRFRLVRAFEIVSRKIVEQWEHKSINLLTSFKGDDRF
jgi:hypothetical protein